MTRPTCCVLCRMGHALGVLTKRGLTGPWPSLDDSTDVEMQSQLRRTGSQGFFLVTINALEVAC